MPEPQGDVEESDENDRKPSKILQFFSPSVKETKKEKVKPLTKVVIRRLPPRMSKETFLEEFPMPPYDYFYFVRGDLNLGMYAYSRAYVNFVDSEDVFRFKEKFDECPLQDELGREYRAVVEWAPFQRIPKQTQKKEMGKSGTLDGDPKFLEFLEKLELEKSNPGGNTSEYFMETDSVTSKGVKVTTTPLLEYIKSRRQKKIDIRNENRLRKREAEKEKRRKEEEMRKADKVLKEKENTLVKKDEVKEVKDDKQHSNEVNPENLVSNKEKIERKPAQRAPAMETPLDKPKNDVQLERVEKKREDIEDKRPKKPAFNTSSKRDATAEINKKESVRSGDVKSKFRYSEQRNRDRELRNQKSLQPEAQKDSLLSQNSSEEQTKEGQVRRLSTTETSDGSVDSEAGQKNEGKDPRTERKIRNKDRPAMEIYRPGMGKFSKQRLEVMKEDNAVKKDDMKSGAKKNERRKDDDIKPFKNKKIIDNSDKIDMKRKTSASLTEGVNSAAHSKNTNWQALKIGQGNAGPSTGKGKFKNYPQSDDETFLKTAKTPYEINARRSYSEEK